MYEYRSEGRDSHQGYASTFVVPDCEALASLEAVTPLLETRGGALTDLDVLDVIAGWSRQAAHAEAMIRQWSAVLATRSSMDPLWRSESGVVLDSGADEIAFRLAIGRRTAQWMVKEGLALRGLLFEVGEAFSAGLIDARRARVFVDELAESDAAVTLAVVEQVLPVAPNLTPTQVRSRIRAVIVQVDPERAGERERLAVAKRRVNLPKPVGDGMAFFSAVLPAVEAMTLYQVCEATARAGRADGDDRTLDQLRADTLVGLAERALSEGCVLPPVDVRVTEVVAATATVATSAAPDVQGELVGQPVASQFAVGYRFAGRASKVHITIPNELLNPDPAVEAPIGAAIIIAAEVAGDEEFLDRVDAEGYVPPTTCALGVDVPDLAGYGAIAPATVRALVNSGKPPPAWLVINPPVDPDDPPSGAPGYRPTAELDRFVRERDRHCCAPMCTVPAASGDVDHIVSWPQGETGAPNLHSLCRRHHLQKTHGGHTVVKNEDGSLTWITRAGQRLTQYPDGRVVRTRAPDRAQEGEEAIPKTGAPPPGIDPPSARLSHIDSSSD